MKKKKSTPTREFEIIECGTYSKRWFIDAKSLKEAWDKRHDEEPIDTDFYPDEQEPSDDEDEL